MTEYTGRFELEIPSENQYYDINQHVRNIGKINSAALKSITISEMKVVSQEDFDAIEKKPDVLYLVTGDSDFTLSYGEKPLKGGGSSSAAYAKYKTTALKSKIYDATVEEVT